MVRKLERVWLGLSQQLNNVRTAGVQPLPSPYAGSGARNSPALEGLARARDANGLPAILEICPSAEAGQERLLDTCVDIDGLQGRAPDTVADLLDLRLSNQSSVAVQELMRTVGVLAAQQLAE